MPVVANHMPTAVLSIPPHPIVVLCRSLLSFARLGGPSPLPSFTCPLLFTHPVLACLSAPSPIHLSHPAPLLLSLLSLYPLTHTPSPCCSTTKQQLVNKAAAKYDQMQLTSFLDAAATGDVDVVQEMLRQGMNPNTADYDGRTALMIAAYKGRKVWEVITDDRE